MVKIATIRAVAELQVGCATARSRVVRVGTLGLHYLEWGSADHPPLLFLHGGSAHAHWFDAVAPAFADRYHVVSLDQRGHGESEWARPATYATEDFAGDLLAVFDALGWRQAIIVGRSEERRVGKEGRTRWARCRSEKKGGRRTRGPHDRDAARQRRSHKAGRRVAARG